MTATLTIVLGIIILGIMVFIHELGHFCAAKWLGFRVLTFSLGFGKPLINKNVNGTDYRISVIPFGGYVKMAGEHPEDDHSPSTDEFQNRPLWQRAIVATAGPAANYVSAMFMLAFMFMWGVDRPSYLERPIIGAVSDSSAAAVAGITAGDSIISMNGRPVASWEDMENVFLTQEKKYTLVLVRDGVSQQQVIEAETGKSASYSQPPFGMQPPLPAVVGSVNGGSPAEAAGLRTGDTVRAIDGNKVHSWFQLTDLIQRGKPGAPLSFVIARTEGPLTIKVTPRFEAAEKRNLIGIRIAEQKGHTVRYALLPAITRCLEKTRDYTTMIFDVLGKLVSRQVSATQLAGPVGIIPASGFVALQGLSPVLNFMALISINLAVLNLFPLIITDGGMLLFLLLEAVRRRPLSLKTQMAINKYAIMFFILLFLFVTFNDIHRMPEMFKMFGK